MLKMRGVRGAITVQANTEEAILEATEELLRTMIAENGIEEDDVASVLFSTSPDLDAAFPARAARAIGWTGTALMGFQEMNVPGSVTYCVRILIHWNTSRALAEINHVYLRGAVSLRPDLNNKQKTL